MATIAEVEMALANGRIDYQAPLHFWYVPPAEASDRAWCAMLFLQASSAPIRRGGGYLCEIGVSVSRNHLPK